MFAVLVFVIIVIIIIITIITNVVSLVGGKLTGLLREMCLQSLTCL